MHMSTDVEKIAKLETSVEFIEKSIEKVADSMGSIKIIHQAMVDCKKFRDDFEKKVLDIVHAELDSKEVIEDLRVAITKEVNIIFDKRAVREALDQKINVIIDSRLKDIKLNAIAWIVSTVFGSTLITGLIVSGWMS